MDKKIEVMTVGDLIKKLKNFDPKKPIAAIKSTIAIYDIYDVIEMEEDIYIDLE